MGLRDFLQTRKGKGVAGLIALILLAAIAGVVLYSRNKSEGLDNIHSLLGTGPGLSRTTISGDGAPRPVEGRLVPLSEGLAIQNRSQGVRGAPVLQTNPERPGGVRSRERMSIAQKNGLSRLNSQAAEGFSDISKQRSSSYKKMVFGKDGFSQEDITKYGNITVPMLNSNLPNDGRKPIYRLDDPKVKEVSTGSRRQGSLINLPKNKKEGMVSLNQRKGTFEWK